MWQGRCRRPQPSGRLIHYSKLRLSFKGLKMSPLCRAALNTNTFIVMDGAAEAPRNLQVPTLLLNLQHLTSAARSHTQICQLIKKCREINEYINYFLCPHQQFRNVREYLNAPLKRLFLELLLLPVIIINRPFFGSYISVWGSSKMLLISWRSSVAFSCILPVNQSKKPKHQHRSSRDSRDGAKVMRGRAA